MEPEASPGTATPIRDASYVSIRAATRRRNAPEIPRRRPISERLGLAPGCKQRRPQTRASKVDAERTGHPLIPVLTTLSTKNRCRKANRISGGSTANVAPAITRFVFMAPRL